MEALVPKINSWSLWKFQYEVLGMSAKQIAEESSNISEGLLLEAIKEQNWKPGNLEALVPTLQSQETADTDTYNRALRAQLLGASLVKQRALFPEFAKAEAVLLNKITEAAATLDISDEKMFNKVSNLVKALQGLLSNNTFLTTTIGDEDDKGTRFVVNVVQQVN